MNIYTLFKITFIVGYYLGGAECHLAKLFKDAVKQYYSGNGAPATVFSIEDYVMQNTRCFVALLRNIQLKLNTISTGTAGTVLNEYDHYFTTSISLLNYDIYSLLHDDIMGLYVALNDAKQSNDFGPVKQRIVLLINEGARLNVWYFETGYMTTQSQDRIKLELKSDNKFFNECATMYSTLKNYNFNQIIVKAIEIVDPRYKLLRSMSFLITESIKNLYSNDAKILDPKNFQLLDETKVLHPDNSDLLQTMRLLGNLIKFYGEFILKTIEDAHIVLVNAAFLNEGTQNVWFIENNESFMVSISITMDIVSRMDMTKFKYYYMWENVNLLFKTYYIPNSQQTLKNEFEAKYTTAKNKFNTSLQNILERKEKPDIEVFSLIKLTDYPDMLGYYPKRELIKIEKSDATTKQLLNMQAFATILPLQIELTIIALKNTKINNINKLEDEAIAEFTN